MRIRLFVVHDVGCLWSVSVIVKGRGGGEVGLGLAESELGRGCFSEE